MTKSEYLIMEELVRLLHGCDWGPLKRVSPYWTTAVDRMVNKAKKALDKHEPRE